MCELAYALSLNDFSYFDVMPRLLILRNCFHQQIVEGQHTISIEWTITPVSVFVPFGFALIADWSVRNKHLKTWWCHSIKNRLPHKPSCPCNIWWGPTLDLGTFLPHLSEVKMWWDWKPLNYCSSFVANSKRQFGGSDSATYTQ